MEVAPEWLDVMGSQGSTLLIEISKSFTQPAQLSFGFRELRAAGIVKALGALTSLVYANISIELLNQIES